MAELRTLGLSHIYSAGTPFEKIALDDINISIPQGQFIGLLGHTGSGKSTLVQHFNALLQPTSGQIFLGEGDINESKKTRYEVRFRVGLVFQYPEYQLFEETVKADIAFGPKKMGLSEAEIDERVREAAGFACVSEELFDKSPLDLSGGQKRRIAIAGVIAMRPEVLILDEPCAGLDPEGSEMILRNLCDYRKASGATVIIISHNMDDTARIADRLIVLENGAVRMDGTPEEVFSEPETLRSLGLTVPKATAIAMALKERGLDLNTPVFTHDQLVAAILRAKEAAKC